MLLLFVNRTKLFSWLRHLVKEKKKCHSSFKLPSSILIIGSVLMEDFGSLHQESKRVCVWVCMCGWDYVHIETRSCCTSWLVKTLHGGKWRKKFPYIKLHGSGFTVSFPATNTGRESGALIKWHVLSLDRLRCLHTVKRTSVKVAGCGGHPGVIKTTLENLPTAPEYVCLELQDVSPSAPWRREKNGNRLLHCRVGPLVIGR